MRSLTSSSATEGVHEILSQRAQRGKTALQLKAQRTRIQFSVPMSYKRLELWLPSIQCPFLTSLARHMSSMHSHKHIHINNHNKNLLKGKKRNIPFSFVAY